MKKFAKPVIGLLALLMILGVGSTLAFLIDSDEPVENIFTPSRVTSEVLEGEDGNTFNGTVKEKVRIKNTGDTDAYIRAAVVVTWKKLEEDGTYSVYGQAPVEGTDYEMIWWNTKSDDDLHDDSWEKGSDGFYYHKAVVEDGGSTSILFTDCKLAEDATAPVGYGLNVEIICSAIQAGQNGPDAAYNAWKGVNLDD